MQSINQKTNQSQKISYQSGQVAIVILLIMVVLLTIGLSLASRTTQELFLSQQEAESARVFNAAEVGLEDALTYDFSTIAEGEVVTLNPNTVEDVSINTSIQSVNTLETQIVEGAAVHLNLTGTTSPDFTVNWARSAEGCDSAASLLISIYYDDNGTSKVIHEALAPGDCRSDDFTVINTGGVDGYWRQATITLPTGVGPITQQFARIRAVYNDTALRVTGTGLTQSFTIRSEATTVVGEESRTVEVGRTLSGAPSFMDYAMYSGAGIVQDAP